MGKQYHHSQLISAAKSGKGKRALSDRMPQIVEPPKNLLALMGHRTSSVGKAVLADIHCMHKPNVKKLQRKNELLPFVAGGEAHMENLCRLNNCALFAMANHNKKRPHNIVFGRTFEFRILDMTEFGIINYVPMEVFPNAKVSVGSKPMIVFNGDPFDANMELRTIQSVLLDVFRGPDDVDAVLLSGLDNVIVFTLQGESTVLFRRYGVTLLKDKESSLPKVSLTEIGPRFDLEIRRVQLSSVDLMGQALKKAKDPTVSKKTKNVSFDELGDKLGKIYVEKQNLASLVPARMKGLNTKRGANPAEQSDSHKTGVEDEPQPERRRKRQKVADITADA